MLYTTVLLSGSPILAEHSVGRQWNEALLEAIGRDQADPTIHARNLFHLSIALYDAWAVYHDGPEQTYFLGKTVGGFSIPFAGVPIPPDPEEARRQAMSYSAYRLLMHRFPDLPALEPIHDLMADLGYDPSFTSTDYVDGNPAALGNYLAEELIQFGLRDGSNERSFYVGGSYTPLNPPLDPARPGHNSLINPNFWQPLDLGGFTPFLTPQWGSVIPFSLKEEIRTTHQRDGHRYPVYHDPGPPPHIDIGQLDGAGERTESRLAPEEYQWGFALVAVWASHLDPADGVQWEISPGTLGNASTRLPGSLREYREFYNFLEGGSSARGHRVNPRTGQPYEEQWVPRADYARVVAEFWADGPSTETPPGHWFTILNYVSDHPLFEKRFKGRGPILDDLEWDVKAYLALGGAMHDAAVASWSIKSWYDYVRPISAIRWMADLGQSSDPDLPSYDPKGLPLIEGHIELVGSGDPLAGADGEHIDKIKLKSWRGPTHITNPDVDISGVGWILAEEWWPYQRTSFVTPAFAGYVSGHSTFSSAAAEVLTLLTGDPFFPGGLGEFRAERNRFLVFEEGPSVDVVLQWATYHDASEQSCLSRMWGGIHPPADDIPARRIGSRVGIEAFAHAEGYFGSASGISGICGRTQAVQEALVDRIPGVYSCAGVTGEHLGDVTGRLSINLDGESLSLGQGDFDGLRSLAALDLSGNGMATLPEGVFDALGALTELDLSGNDIAALPEGVFGGLSSLTALDLSGNSMTALSEGAFDGLSALTELDLSGNDLTTFPFGEFEALSALTVLRLEGNPGYRPAMGVEPGTLAITAGEGGAYRIRLYAPPDSTVAVVAVASADPKIAVTPSILTFSEADYFRSRPVTVNVASDAEAGIEAIHHSVSGYDATPVTPPMTVEVVMGGPAALLGIKRMTVRSSVESEAVTVEAAFDFTVVVDASRGTPTLELTVGGVARRAAYQRGSGTSRLTFVYEATEEDDLRDVQVRKGSLRLNGGTMRSQDYAIVEATIQGTPAEGLTVELSRSISGRFPRYNWRGSTDSEGHVILTVYSTDRSGMAGYYLGRARTADGRVIGEWSSIPLNSGFHHSLTLVSGGGQRVVAVRPLVAARPAATGGLPVVSALDAIWPNPSNGVTRIAYHLAATGPVRLQVYNVLGQGVRALVDQVQSAGHYQVEWDGRDQGGAGAASGVYIVGLHHRDGFTGERLLYLK